MTLLATHNLTLLKSPLYSTKMSLVPDYDSSSSSSDSEDDTPSPEPVTRPSEETAAKLPAPNFFGGGDPEKTSVFKNPFTEAENAKEAILQKHVKMVDAKTSMVVINGKKICWNYRKGRCRFGHNCKYAHDSDLQVESERKVQRSVVCQRQPSEQEVDGVIRTAPKGKKRPGLTQGLIPGKKVMKNYARQKL